MSDIIDIVKKEIPDIAPHFKSIMIAVVFFLVLIKMCHLLPVNLAAGGSN